MKNSIQVNTRTRIITNTAIDSVEEIEADVCVVGSGISGISAAVKAAKLGRKVVLVEGMSVVGGLSGNAAMSLFCGFFTPGEAPKQITYGIASEFFKDLKEDGRLYFTPTIAVYDEVALQRWFEKRLQKYGVTLILNSMLYKVNREGRRISSIEFTSRFGKLKVIADGYVDATGDAAVAWNAGLPCRESDIGPLYGTQLVALERVHAPRPEDQPLILAKISKALEDHADEYGLMRKVGFVKFPTPFGEDVALVNMTHIETPMEPVQLSQKTLEGKDQADGVISLLKDYFPEIFADAVVSKYGVLGIRQTRWIKGSHHLTVDEVVEGVCFEDSIGRSSWPVELHDHKEGYVWKTFPPEHVHYIPFGSLVPPDIDNLVACGRCIDGDLAALSSVRVMGPCVATGEAAAAALVLAGKESIHSIDIKELQKEVADNISRLDLITKY